MAPFSLQQPLLALRTVLSVPALRRSLAAYLLFNSAEWAVWVAVLVYAHEFGGTTAAAIAVLVQLLPAAVIAPFAAALADRTARERMLAWTYFAQASAMSIAVACLLLDAPPMLVLAAATLVSVAISLSRPVYLSSLPAFARTPPELTAANSVSTMIESLAVLVGPTIAALLTELAGPALVFALFAVGQALAGLLAWRPASAGAVSTTVMRSSARLSDWFAGLAELRVQPHGKLLLAYVGVAHFLVGMADVLAVVLAFEILTLGPSGPGVLISAMGFGGMLGAAASIMLVGRRRLGPALAAALLVAGVPFAMAGLVSELFVAVLLLAAAGAGKCVLEVASRTLLQRSMDEDLLARVFALQEGLMLLALAAGAMAVPLLVSVLGPRGAFFAAGLMLPLLAASTWRRLRTIDALATLPSSALALLRRVPMFGHLPTPIIERLASRLQVFEFGAQETVIRQGEPGGHFYVVESGQLAVAVDGQPRPALLPGDSFGEIALMRDLPRTATVTTLTAARLWALDRATFLAAITGSRRAATEATRVADARLAATAVTKAAASGDRQPPP